MPDDIASLSDNLDYAAKLIRVLSNAGVTIERITQIIQDKGVRRNLAEYLSAGCPQLPLVIKTPSEFPTFVTLEIGGKTGNDWVEEMRQKGVNVTHVKELLTRPIFPANDPKPLSVVRARVRHLGFYRRPTTQELFARIIELGYDLLPTDALPPISIAYREKELGKHVCLAIHTPDQPVFMISDRLPLGGNLDVFPFHGYAYSREETETSPFRSGWPMNQEILFAKR